MNLRAKSASTSHKRNMSRLMTWWNVKREELFSCQCKHLQITCVHALRWEGNHYGKSFQVLLIVSCYHSLNKERRRRSYSSLLSFKWAVWSRDFHQTGSFSVTVMEKVVGKICDVLWRASSEFFWEKDFKIAFACIKRRRRHKGKGLLNTVVSIEEIYSPQTRRERGFASNTS